jgi:transposase
MSEPNPAPNPDCPSCILLLRRIEELEAIVRDLQARLNQNSSNSSIPPSANPLGAPKLKGKSRDTRKPKRRRGGQPGHKGHFRLRLPADRVDIVIPYIPKNCSHCQTALPQEPSPNDLEPTRHQVVELPEKPVVVTEHQGHARSCVKCGKITRFAIPEQVRSHTFGPKLTAFLSYLCARHHVSRRGVREIVETALNVPISLGTICRLEQETSAALATPHQEAGEAARAAAAKNVDETGWKKAGKRCWLWAAATATVAYFVIHARRNWQGLQALLGEMIQGFVTSDRWGTYGKLILELRQICWAHLKRDFQKLVDRGGEAKPIGEAGLDLVRRTFELWWAFRGGTLDRASLQEKLEPIARELHEALERGCACADGKTATFCGNILALEPALWSFVQVEGIEPTNNHAERILRGGVLWRKNAFGSHSEEGCRFAERMLTVIETLRLRERNVLDYLHLAVSAQRQGLPAPKLLS